MRQGLGLDHLLIYGLLSTNPFGQEKMLSWVGLGIFIFYYLGWASVVGTVTTNMRASCWSRVRKRQNVNTNANGNTNANTNSWAILASTLPTRTLPTVAFPQQISVWTQKHIRPGQCRLSSTWDVRKTRERDWAYETRVGIAPFAKIWSPLSQSLWTG